VLTAIDGRMSVRAGCCDGRVLKSSTLLAVKKRAVTGEIATLALDRIHGTGAVIGVTSVRAVAISAHIVDGRICARVAGRDSAGIGCTIRGMTNGSSRPSTRCFRSNRAVGH
jgi:hypothetical protein